MFRKFSPLVGGIACLFALSSYAGTVIQYGDNVTFSYDDTTLFGLGTVVGDNIFFVPEDFISQSLNGDGLVETFDTLDLQVVVTTEGFWLSDFAVAEQGDYQLFGSGASASVSGDFTVTSNTSSFTDTNSFNAGPLTVQNALTEWTANTGVNLSDTSGWGGDTDVNLSLYNLAATNTQALGEQAFLQKKIGGVAVMVSAIPVPAAVWMFGSGLIALFGWAGRRKLA